MKNKFFANMWAFFKRNWKLITAWLLIVIFIEIGIHLHMDKKVIAILVFLFGIFSQAFTGLAAIIAMIPILGPLLVKILSLPVFWLLNIIGYYFSLIMIKKGYGKDMINYRVVSIVFALGFTIGFIIARLI